MAAVVEGLRVGMPERRAAGNWALQAAVRLWFVVAFVGQFLFVVHIVSFYGRTAAVSDFASWNKHLAVGYVAGDNIGNGALGVHLAMAAVITFCGLLQLIPQIRQYAPSFHRWVGRVYIPAAFLASLSALYLILIRGKVIGSPSMHWGNVLNALVIMLCAAMAWRYALTRELVTHRRWALRLFLAVNASWFFRVGLFFWLIINRGPVGFNDDTFEGPFLTFLSFAEYLLPLAVLQAYLLTQSRGGPVSRYVMAGTLVLLTVAMAIGSVGHAMHMVSTGAAV
jgi:hypothetical protein